jgi:hypothetical protein
LETDSMTRALLALLLASAPALSQTAQPAPAPAAQPIPAPAPAPAQVVLAPRFTALQGQSADRQALDDAQCQNQATQMTGFVLGSQPPAPTAQQGATGNRVRGAAVGAATGAIVGSAGSGAAAGTVAGGSANRSQRRQAEKADRQARAQWDQQQQAWGKQYAACMQARGYSVP